MLFEKKTLFGLLVDWFTGWSAVSPGHWPFCARASISVPGAPPSSLVTGSQVEVLKPGVEICAPDWVATALLCTSQPLLPRLEISLAPVPDGETLTAARCAAAGCVTARACGTATAGAPWALDTRQVSAMTETTTVAVQREEREKWERMVCRIAGTPVPRHLPQTTGAPLDHSVSS